MNRLDRIAARAKAEDAKAPAIVGVVNTAAIAELVELGRAWMNDRGGFA